MEASKKEKKKSLKKNKKIKEKNKKKNINIQKLLNENYETNIHLPKIPLIKSLLNIK